MSIALKKFWRPRSSFLSPEQFDFPEPVSAQARFPPKHRHIFSVQGKSAPEPDEFPPALDLIVLPAGMPQSPIHIFPATGTPAPNSDGAAPSRGQDGRSADNTILRAPDRLCPVDK